MNKASELTLFSPIDGYTPRVAAVHDLCGYGKCSLGVAIPVLSAGGCDVCPVPTGLFSSHTGFPTFYVHDTTEMLDGYVDAWGEAGVELDAVYSGFLGSPEQVAVISRLCREHPRALRVVDPVMGDGGKIYPTYTDELCDEMRSLVDGADLLTPNLTEASILTGIPYEGSAISDEKADELVGALVDMGAKVVVLKGIVRGDGLIRNVMAGRDLERDEVSSELLPFMLHGTGDLFASALLAAVMRGRSVHDAMAFASEFVSSAMHASSTQPDFERRGVSFESVLGEVTALVR